ncbi:SDR family NAD(P)-dependent oxidoreductase, partial [Limosilactobacillus reuteri]|uniref:SDR family NAD(P)-dependent oxidoreductase n=1 Tax=Limosilactobacillus reuteri TaxID=1598 RepID=UPI001CDB9100
AERLFNDGFNVAIVDFNEEGAKKAAEALSKEGQEAVAFRADVSDRENVFDVTRKVVEHFGELNVVVNNAGLGPIPCAAPVTSATFLELSIYYTS